MGKTAETAGLYVSLQHMYKNWRRHTRCSGNKSLRYPGISSLSESESDSEGGACGINGVSVPRPLLPLPLAELGCLAEPRALPGSAEPRALPPPRRPLEPLPVSGTACGPAESCAPPLPGSAEPRPLPRTRRPPVPLPLSGAAGGPAESCAPPRPLARPLALDPPQLTTSDNIVFCRACASFTDSGAMPQISQCAQLRCAFSRLSVAWNDLRKEHLASNMIKQSHNTQSNKP